MKSVASIRNAALHPELLPSLSTVIALECQTLLEEIARTGNIMPHAMPPGPYDVVFSLQENRFEITLRTDDKTPPVMFSISLQPLRTLIRDYVTLCASYQFATEGTTPYRIEAIDMGRRGLHDEGAVAIMDALKSDAIIDMETARRLFSLIVLLSRRIADRL